MGKGILGVLSGFSGSAKGTIENSLIAQYPDTYSLSISATTRAPRAGEQEGVHYFFKTVEEFEAMIAAGELVEYARFVNNYYGTPWEYVRSRLEEGRSVILEIEMQGALQVRAKFPDTRLIFVTPPSAEELRNRLVKRGTENEEAIAQRLHRAAEEADYIPQYDYLIVNDRLEDAVDDFHHIIEAERARDAGEDAIGCVYHVEHMLTGNNLEFIDRIKQELLDISNQAVYTD